MAESPFPISIATPSGELSFDDADSVNKWSDKIADAYSWIDVETHIGELLRRELENFVNHFRNEATAAANAKRNSTKWQAHVSTLTSQINEFVTSDRRYLLPSSPELLFCQEIARTDARLATATLWGFIRKWDQRRDMDLQARGLAVSSMFALGFTNPIPAYKSSHEELILESRNELAAISNDRSKAKKHVNRLRKSSIKLRARERRNFRDFSEETRKGWAQLQEAYDKKLALSYSVRYWERKAHDYNRNAWLFGVAASIAASLFAFGIGWWAVELFEVIAESESPRWWQLSIVAIYATIGLWLIRILTKSLMANMHLKVDAEQRTTMVTTYLALLKEGRALEDDDRRIIIEALFRPIHSGLVPGDSGNQSVIEQLAGLMTRRSLS